MATISIGNVGISSVIALLGRHHLQRGISIISWSLKGTISFISHESRTSGRGWGLSVTEQQAPVLSSQVQLETWTFLFSKANTSFYIHGTLSFGLDTNSSRWPITMDPIRSC